MPSRLHPSLVSGLASLLVCCVASTASADETHVLASQVSSGDLTRVTAQLEVGGDLKLVSDGKVKPLPMSVAANLVYDELLFSAEAKAEHLSSLRYYNRAEATIKIEQGGAKPSLRESHRLIGCDWGSAGITLFSPQGPLKRDELDLLMLPANSLLLNALLPEEPVAVGATWKHSEPLLAALLDLDAVSTSEVQSTLKGVQPKRIATLELSGKLDGAIYGVSTKIELKGRYTYDFTRKRVTNLVLLVNEDRSIGHVATGLDVTSKITLAVTPLTHSDQLNVDKVEQITFEADPARNPLVHESITGGYRMYLDRRWHSVLDEAKLLTLRFVDRGDLLAQCNIAPLEKASPGERVSLQKFQADIREALKDNFGQFLRASEGTDSRGRTIYTVIANGRVSELPIQWNYYLVADRQGHQVAFAFTLEEGLVERFGDTDRQLVGSLEFFDPPAPTTASPAPAASRR